MTDTIQKIADDMQNWRSLPAWQVDQLHERLRALSARASAGEGGEYVLVPREPTDEMLRVWLTHQEAAGGRTGGDMYPWMRALRRYQKMLTAAPQPAQAGASGGGELIGHLYRVAHTDKAAARPWESSGTVFVAGPAPVDGRRGAIQHLNVYAYASPATVDAATWEEEIRKHDATPQPAAAHPELPSAQGWLDSHCAVATTEWMRGWDAARSALAAAAPQPQEAPAQERDDSGPYEFGAGIPDNPKAKYWQDRAYFWRSHAIALGYVAGDGTQHCHPAHGDGEGDDVTETIIRDVCELDPSDPEHHDTVCIKRHHLRQIIKRTLALPAQGEG